MSLYRIDELFNFEKGSLQSSKCEAGEYNFITASADWKTHKVFTYDCEALVFAAAASGSLGRTHYVNDKFIASDLCFVLTPRDVENFPIDLQFYHLIFRELRKDIVKNTKAGTSKEAISLGNFAKYKLPYFDIEKQSEIKNRFVKAEATKENLTANLNHQLALIKELRQAYLREAMQGKLVPQDSKDEPAEILLERIKAEKEKLVAEKKIKRDKPLPPIKPEEVPFEIPANWTWCRLGDIVSTIFDGPFGSHLKTADYTEKGIQVIRLENIGFLKFNVEKETFISEQKYETIRQHTVYENDILVSSFIADGVKTTLIPALKHTAIAKADCFTVRTFENWAVKKFIVYALSSEPIFEEFLQFSHGMTRLRINTSQLRKLMFPLPPLAEQERIVARLDKLMGFCDELESNIKQGIANADDLLQTALKEALEPKGNACQKITL